MAVHYIYSDWLNREIVGYYPPDRPNPAYRNKPMFGDCVGEKEAKEDIIIRRKKLYDSYVNKGINAQEIGITKEEAGASEETMYVPTRCRYKTGVWISDDVAITPSPHDEPNNNTTDSTTTTTQPEGDAGSAGLTVPLLFLVTGLIVLKGIK